MISANTPEETVAKRSGRRVLLAKPRGYCAGVDRAVQAVEVALELYGAPVYVRKQIVQNTHVVAGLEKRGAIFVEETGEVPEGAVIVFSAHGVAPQVRAEAERRNLRTIDATCPLVTKVHNEARRFAAQGYDILLIGHEGHEEVVGTTGEAPASIRLVDGPVESASTEVRDPAKVAWLSQTTLSVDETQETVAALRKRFPLRGHGLLGLIHRQRRLRQPRHLGRIPHPRGGAVLRAIHQVNVPRRLPGRADDLLVPLVPDQQDLVALGGEPPRLVVHLGDQRAGRVDRVQAALAGILADLRSHAVRGEHDNRALRHLLGFLHEHRAAGFQGRNHVGVVHDLLTHVDRCAVQFQGYLNCLYGPVHPRTVAAGLGEQYAPGLDRHASHGKGALR